eukprot:GEMP01053994.1.p1 GENE.GEMP01053994.1~~GEMP01053994.1.p1  ORF type:complete len:263 (+),score=86.30 GEMP01053994.1:56-844(+)
MFQRHKIIYRLQKNSDPTTITDQLVKEAFHRAILQLAPENNGFPEALKACESANHAYKTLKKEQRRAEYGRNPAAFPVLSIPENCTAAPAKLPTVEHVASHKQKLLCASTVRVTSGDVGTRCVIGTAALDDSNDTQEEAASRTRIMRSLEEAWSKQAASGMITCPASDAPVYAECVKQVTAEVWRQDAFVLEWKCVEEGSGALSSVEAEKYLEVDLWSHDVYDRLAQFVAGEVSQKEMADIVCAYVENCKALFDKLFNQWNK